MNFFVQLEATWSQLEAHLVAKKLHVAGLAGLVRLVGLARLAGLAGLVGLGRPRSSDPPGRVVKLSSVAATTSFEEAILEEINL